MMTSVYIGACHASQKAMQTTWAHDEEHMRKRIAVIEALLSKLPE